MVKKSCCDCLVWPLKITVLTTPAVSSGKYSVSLKPETASAELPQCGVLTVTAPGLVLSERTVKRKHAKKIQAKFIPSSGTEAAWSSQGWVDTLWTAAVSNFSSTSVLYLVIF